MASDDTCYGIRLFKVFLWAMCSFRRTIPTKMILSLCGRRRQCTENENWILAPRCEHVCGRSCYAKCPFIAAACDNHFYISNRFIYTQLYTTLSICSCFFPVHSFSMLNNFCFGWPTLNRKASLLLAWFRLIHFILFRLPISNLLVTFCSLLRSRFLLFIFIRQFINVWTQLSFK